MQEVNLTPELRFPEFKTDWFEIKLSDLLTFKNGVNAAKEDYGDGYKFINVLDIIQNDYITHDRILGSVNIPEAEFQKNIVEYGDILFQRSSETREEVGQANVYLDRDVPATFGGFVIRGKKKADYDPSYMNALLKTTRSRKEITSKSGGSTRYNVGQDTLSSVIIYTTELEEQQKIAAFLTAVDERIQLLQQKKAKLEEYKKGVMQKIFSQEIRFKPAPSGVEGDENGNDFPDWEEKKLGEVSKITTGSSNRKDSGLDGEFTFFDRSDEIRTSSIYLFDTEAVIVPGEGSDFIPKYFIGKFDLHQRTYAIIDFDNVLGKFIFYRMQFSRKHLLSQAVGSTVKSLRLPIFQKWNLSIPALEEQKKIATFLTTLDESIASVEKQIEVTTTFKKGLLQKMFV